MYANANTSISEIMEKVKGASQLANISGMTGEETTKALQSITNQFKLMSKEGANAGEVTSHIGDVLTAVSQNMSVDFASGLKELNSAIKTSGSVAEMAGMSLESYTSLIGALVQQTGLDGAELANSVKFITGRILQIKSIGDEEGIDSSEMAKAEKAITAMGVSIREKNGGLRDLDSILSDISKKWSSLNDQQKQNYSEAIAGQRQRAVFISMMESMNVKQNLYNDALKSTGALQEANDKKAQSIEGKMNTLKTTVNQMWSNLLSSDGVKGTIDGLTKLVETFGNLAGVVGIATTAFLVWKGTAITTWIVEFNEAFALTALEFGEVTTATGLMTNAVGMLGGAFTSLAEIFVANPFGLVAVALTSAIALFSVFRDKVKSTDEVLSDLKTHLDDLSSLKKDESSLNEMKKLQDQLKSNTLSTEEQQTAKEKLLTLEKQFASTYASTITGITKEGEEISTNTKLIEKQIEAKKKLAGMQSKEDYNQLIDKIGTTGTLETSLSESDRKKVDNNGIAILDYQKLNSKSNLTDSQLKQLKEYIKEFEGLNEAVIKLNQAGISIDGKKMFDFETGKLVDAKKYIEEISTSEKDATKSSNDTNKALSGMGETAEDTAKKFSDLADAFSGYTDKVSLLQKALDELNKNGALGSDTIASIIKTGDTELIGALGNKNTIADVYASKLEGFKSARDEELKTIIQSAQVQQGLTNAVDGTTQAVTNSANIQQQATKQTTDNNAKQYNTDVKNNAQSSNSKKEVSKTLTNAMLKNNADFTNTVNSFYGTDVANKINAENEKGNASANVINQTLSANANAVDQMGTHYAMDVENFQKAQKAKLDSLMTLTNNPLDTQNKLKDYKSFVDNGTSNPTYKPVTGSAPQVAYNPVSASYDPVSVNDSGSGGDSGKSATDYTVKDLESMRNAFYNLNNAIDDVKNASDRLSKQIETAYGKDKENLIENRINLLRQEKDLTQQLINSYGTEIWNKRVELDSKVRSMGATISFDGQGNIVSRNETLEYLRQSVNAMGSYDDASKQAKESAQENVKEIETLISSYDELQNGLASTTSSYDDLTSSIREAYKSMADSVVDGESKIAEVIKNAWQKKLDTVTKYADQLKEKINSTYEENTYQDDKAKAEKELLDIKQAMNEAVKSGDKELFNTLKKQYQDQQDSINSMIKDKEKDNALNAIDKSTQKLQDAMDEALKPENLTKSITTALQQGYIVVGGEVQKLSDATTQYLKDTQTGTETLTLAMDEYTKSLASALEMYSKLNDIDSNIGVVTSYTPSNAVNDVNKNWNNIVSQNSVSRAVNISMPINISSVNGVDDLQDQLQDWANTIYKTIDYQLGVK